MNNRNQSFAQAQLWAMTLFSTSFRGCFPSLKRICSTNLIFAKVNVVLYVVWLPNLLHFATKTERLSKRCMVSEAFNAQRLAQQFSDLSSVYVPRIKPELTTCRCLVMEYIR